MVSQTLQIEGVVRKKFCQLRQETEAHLARQLSQRLQRKFQGEIRENFKAMLKKILSQN